MSNESTRQNESGLSRRHFLGGVGVALAGVAGSLALSACSETAEGETGVVSYTDSIKWDAEYDAVVVGFGVAGAAAAITAADAGVEKVLILEKAPYGEEGGNSKVAEQYCLSFRSEKDGVEYMTAMSEGFASASPEVINFMAKGGTENKAWVASLGLGEIESVLSTDREMTWDQMVAGRGYLPTVDFALGEYFVERPNGTWSFGEYPVMPDGVFTEGRAYWGSLGGPDREEKRLWKGMRQLVVDRADKIDIWLESPAIALIQEPISKTILGVRVNRKGSEINVRALNGVALTCGSLEANKAMLETFAQRGETYPVGTTHNTGDGIIMGMAAGAEMWHMSSLSGPWLLPKIPNVDRCYWFNSMRHRFLAGAECIHVDSRGKRFGAEQGWHKHGHVRVGDTMQNQQTPREVWAIFNDQADTLGNVPMIDPSLVFSASSPEELAQKIGIDAGAFAKTISDYNTYCASGSDVEFNRDARTMAALDTTTLRAVRLYSCVVNSQAGPRRNISCEVITPDGTPIPGLYSAGELGSFWAGVYECGGNIAECLYTGRTAGQGLTTKVQLPEIVVYTKAESNPVISGNDVVDIEAGAMNVTLGPDEYLGVAEGLHGSVIVKVKYVNGTIESVVVVEQYETPELTVKVWSDMPTAMVAANSAEVDTISGATVSSHALIAAVEDAISQAK